MAQLIFPLQKKISLILIAGGLFSVVLNALNAVVSQKDPVSILGSPSVFPVLILSLFFLITFRRNHGLIRGIQVLTFFFYATLAILDSYSSLYGHGFFCLSLILSLRYGYFRRQVPLKAAALLFYLCLIVEYSADKNRTGDFGDVLKIFFFLLFFIITLGAIYRDKLYDNLRQERMRSLLMDRFRRDKEEYEKEIAHLQAERNVLENRIRKIRAKQVDLSQYGFTKKEERIIELLCRTNGTNQEIGYELQIAPGTVKQHMNRIFKKLHVKSRTQVISLCQGNFLESD